MGCLDLITYFTAGPKETRAWTIKTGTQAPQAAGVIHTDFEKGFIRAETIGFDDYIEFSGEAGAKEKGKMRLRGQRLCGARRGRVAFPVCDLDDLFLL